MVTKTLSENPITLKNKRWEWVFSLLVYYRQHFLSFVFNSIAFTCFLLLWTTSYKLARKQLGRNKRKGLHSMEYAFLTFVILHILAIGKFPNWIQWFRAFDLPVPPGTMVPSFFATTAILLKVTDRVVSGRTELSC